MLELVKAELTESGIPAERFISINFEDMRNSRLLTANALHEEILKRARDIEGKAYLFFDEIQEVADWEKCINSLRVSLDCDIYITGSNAKLLSGELATYLGGRYVEFVIYPFSFSEFLELYHTVDPNATIPQSFQKYLLSGDGPQTLGTLEPSRQYLTDVFNSVQLKDIVKRNGARCRSLRADHCYAYNVGTTFSNFLVKFLKSERTVAAETVLNYIKYCCDAYLLYQVKEDLQGKQILPQRKIHCRPRHREAVWQYAGHQPDP